MLYQSSRFSTLTLLVAGVLLSSAPASAQFTQELTLSRLHQPPFQQRVVVGSAVKPYRFGIVEPGTGIEPRPPACFGTVDIAAFSVGEFERGTGPAVPASLAYNGYERDGILSNIQADQFSPDWDFPPLPDDPDIQTGEQFGDEFVLMVTPDFSGYSAGQRVYTGVILAEHGFAFDPAYQIEDDPGLAPFDPYDPSIAYADIPFLMTGPAGSPVAPFSAERNGLRIYLLQTSIVDNTTLSTVAGPADPVTQDVGRHMVGQTLGQLTVGDNDLGGNGTQIVVRGKTAGGQATLGNGLVLESSTDSNFTFESSGETFDLAVRRSIAGAYDFTGPNAIALPGDNGVPDGSGGITQAFGDAGTPLITAEDIDGSLLNLSGVTIAVKGVAVDNRQLSDATLALGRVIVAAPSHTGPQSGEVYVTTGGDDAMRTRLRLGANTQGGGTDGSGRQLLSVQALTDTDFTGPTDVLTGANRAVLQLGYEFDTAAPLGVQVVESLEIGAAISTLENGGLGLAGESVQASLLAGVTYTPVENNRVLAEDVIVVGLDAASVPPIAGAFTNASVMPQFDAATHTDITADSSFVLTDVTQTPGQGLQPIQTETLTVANGRIVPEGLTGETIESASYQVSAIVLKESVARRVTTGPVGDGEQIWVQNDADTDPGEQAAVELIDVVLTGGDAGRFDVTLEPGDDGRAEAGGLIRFDVGFDFTGTDIAPGGFDRLYTATANIRFDDAVPAALAASLGLPDASVLATPLRDARTPFSRTWQLNQLIQAPPNPGGDESDNDFEAEGNFDNDFDFGDGPIFMIVDGATSVTIADSNPLSAVTSVAIQILVDPARDPQGGSGPAAPIPTTWRDANDYGCTLGDFVQINGLDGELFVLEMTYDDAERQAAAPNVPEWRAQINWLDEDAAPPAWVNAVLGNSDIDDYTATTVTVDGNTSGLNAFLSSRRHVMSYQDYLLQNGGEPTLGDFGVDTVNNVMWSVIDHNSVFAAAILPPELPGDTDGDGDIDDADLGTAFANYTGPLGAAGGKSAAQGDADADGDVDDADLGIAFASYTGPLNAPGSVPEPSALALLAGTALLVTRRRR